MPCFHDFNIEIGVALSTVESDLAGLLMLSGKNCSYRLFSLVIKDSY